MNNRSKAMILSVLILTACSANIDPQDFVKPVIKNTQQAQTRVSTSTPVPLPTINYQSTMDVIGTEAAYAQLTAQAAYNLSVQATNDHEQRLQEQLFITQEVARWTATAQYEKMITSIPLTLTQQSIYNTQIPAQQILIAARITQTREAPDQMLKVSAAENMAKYGFLDYLIRYLLMFSLCFFLVCMGIWMFRRPVERIEYVRVTEDRDDDFIIPIQDYAQDKGAVVTVRNEASSFTEEMRYVFPCTPEQLDELADKAINKGTLAYDSYAGKNSKFTRETYAPVYSFMLANRLAKSTGVKNKGIILTDKDYGLVNGRDILLGWLNTRTLPDPFETLETGKEAGATPPPVLSTPDNGLPPSVSGRVQETRVQDREPGELYGLRSALVNNGE